MKAQHKANPPQTWDTVERWQTDGNRVWRAPGGPTVCVLGDPLQPSLFADVDSHQWRDAALIACAPRLAAALADCATRLERAYQLPGAATEFIHLAVRDCRQLLAEAKGIHPSREGDV